MYKLNPIYRRMIMTGLFAAAIFSLAILASGIAARNAWVIGLDILLFGAYFFMVLRGLVTAVDQVQVDADRIRVRTFFGKRLEVKWDQISELRFKQQGTWSGPATLLDVSTQDGRQDFVLSSRLPRFDQLVAEIRARAPHAKELRPGTA